MKQSKKGEMAAMGWITTGILVVIGFIIVFNVVFSSMGSVNNAAAMAVANSTGTPSAGATNVLAIIWPYLLLLGVLVAAFAGISYATKKGQ